MVHLPGGFAATQTYISNTHTTSAVSCQRTKFEHLPVGILPRLPRLRPSPTCAPNWCISREGSHPRLSTSATVTPPPDFYLCPQDVYLLGGGLAIAPYTSNAHAVSSCFLPEHQFGASPGRDCVTPLSTSGHLLSASPVGAPPRERPCHAFLHKHTHAAFGRLLPVHPVAASPGRGLCHVS